MLITDEYREMQRKLHENPGYGVASVTYAQIFADPIRQMGVTEILDYGAGKGRFGQTLRQRITTPIEIHHYDPAVPEWSGTPEPDRKSTRLNSSHMSESRMPSSA